MNSEPLVPSADAPSASVRSVEPIRDFSRSLPMALLKARESVMSRFRPFLREAGITEQQWRVLRALHSARLPLRASELSQSTLLSLPSLSRLLKTLEERKAIRRATSREDLRSAEISITRAGTQIVEALAPVSEKIYADISNAIGAADLDQLYALLETCVDRLGTPVVADTEE
jgi:homoprotocatechuate degradation regulator HpaR